MPTNSTIAAKCLGMQPLWNKLSRSMSTYSQKIRAVKAKAWPSCLHAVASVHLGDDIFTKLRTGVVKGLKEYSPGTSPIVHTSMVEHPLLDPQYFAIQSTVLTFREMHADGELADALLWTMHQPARTNAPKPGPVSILLARLHQIAWSWYNKTVFVDHLGDYIDVLFCPIQELLPRLRGAWQDRVKAEVAHRETFPGVLHVSAPLTTENFGQHDPADLALLRASLNGTFFTADRKKFSEPGADSKCAFCGEEDSQFHRHWECPAFDASRAVPADQIPAITSISPCLSHHGWVPEPPSLRVFKQACLTVPDSTHEFDFPFHMPSELHIFTDGSCLSPACQYSRLAGWGFVVADDSFHAFHPTASGILSGWVQTILRAEITAVLSAMSFIRLVQKPAYLWIDNWTLYRRLCKFMTSAGFVKPNQKDSDLWRQLQLAVELTRPFLVAVSHVFSHQKLDSNQSDLDNWVFRGNSAADTTAAVVLQQACHLHVLRRQVQEDLQQVRLVRDLVHKTIIQVGRTAVQAPSATDSQARPAARVPARSQDIQEVNALPMICIQPDTVRDRYRWDGMVRLFQWLPTIVDSSAPVSFVSYFQVNALWEHETGSRGLKYCKRRKGWFPSRPPMRKDDFVKRTNMFAKYVNAVMTEQGQGWRGYHLRPQSSVVSFWTYTWPLQILPQKLALADDILKQSQPRYSSVGALRTIEI
eukprot:Skav236365  [mRNA]  locus=scaffold1770:35721:37823:+ [translate_table: standard]